MLYASAEAGLLWSPTPHVPYVACTGSPVPETRLSARLGASENGVLARWAGRALRGGCAGCAGACAGCGVWLQGCCLGSRRCTPPIRDLIGLPTLVARFPTAGALPEGPGRPVLGLRRVHGCASGAVWAGGTCLQAGCAPKPPQGLWCTLGVPSISPLHGDGAELGTGDVGRLVRGTAAASVR